MGRPLFSRSSAQPAVHVEPEVTHPTYERWTYMNAFDPDSDEFFRDAQDEMPVLEGTMGRIATTPIVVEVESSSSSSSEASTSGRATPVEEEVELSQEELSDRTRRRLVLLRSRVESSTGETVRSNATNPLVDDEANARLNGAPNAEDVDDDASSPAPFPTTQIAPEPVATAAASRVAPIPIPGRPSTPPNHAAFYDGTPSPAPSVTPRIYTWSRTVVAQSPSSPLPNRGARRSVAHIEELTPFPVRRVVV